MFFIRLAALVFIKIIILHIVLNIVILQVLIIFFRAVTCIGSDNIRCVMVLLFVDLGYALAMW